MKLCVSAAGKHDYRTTQYDGLHVPDRCEKFGYEVSFLHAEKKSAGSIFISATDQLTLCNMKYVLTHRG